MKTHPKPVPLMSLNRLKSKINLSDDRFQRSAVWNLKQEQFLMDTIIREFDIPKVYFWDLQNDGSNYSYSVVDGQQRLTTIFRFFNNEFALSEEITPEYANKKFEDLPEEIQIKIDSYPLTIVYIENATEDDIRDLFLRLNNGTTLKSQEKRTNLGGSLSKFIVKMSKDKIFEKVTFKNKHRDFEQLLAQCIKLELDGGYTNTQGKYLDEMYKDEKDFDKEGTTAKKFKKVLNYMYKIFENEDKVPELKRFNFISLYLMVSQMIDKFVITGKEELFKNFIVDFWQDLTEYRKQEKLEESSRNNDYDDFIQYISSRTDSLESIKGRHEILLKYFLLRNPALEIYDNDRNFTEEQRLTIYRRDKSVCWHCNNHVDWKDFEADHRPTPWSKGGKTTVGNGVCAHKSCNVKASNKDNLIKGWLKGELQ